MEKEVSQKERNSFIKKIFGFKEVGILIAIIVAFIFLSLISPYFLSVSNILNVARQISMIAIIAVGMGCVIISGEIDLSVGSTFGLSAVLLASMIKWGINPFLSII